MSVSPGDLLVNRWSHRTAIVARIKINSNDTWNTDINSTTSGAIEPAMPFLVVGVSSRGLDLPGIGELKHNKAMFVITEKSMGWFWTGLSTDNIEDDSWTVERA